MNIKLSLLVTISLVFVFGRLEIVYAQQSPLKETSCQQSAKEILSEIDRGYKFSAASDKILVVGEAHVAELLANERQFSLTQALAIVGGLSRNARRTVYLLRWGTDYKAQTLLEMDLREIKMGLTKDLLLENGDVVFVPRRCSNGKLMPFQVKPMKPPGLIDTPIRFRNVPFGSRGSLKITPNRTIQWA